MIDRKARLAYKKRVKDFQNAEREFLRKYPYLHSGGPYNPRVNLIASIIAGVLILILLWVIISKS